MASMFVLFEKMSSQLFTVSSRFMFLSAVVLC